MLSVLGLQPDTYVPSVLHAAERTFRESNCYVDLWIELLHARGFDPAGLMSFALTVDFEGDQWTFFKPPPEELEHLYGIDVHEMQFYRPAADHVVEQLSAGRMIIIEVDSFYLPDTAATSYRRSHVKSSIAIESIDPAEKRLRYFHGTGYHELSNDDYCGLFRLGRPYSEDVLPPYVELVRFHRDTPLKGEQLRRAVGHTAARQLVRVPNSNPWIAFGKRLSQDLGTLLAGTEDQYHAYAFATVRQCGAAFELAASFFESIGKPGCPHVAAARQALERQVAGAKTLLFKLARRRPFDSSADIAQLACDWEQAVRGLRCLTEGCQSAGIHGVA